MSTYCHALRLSYSTFLVDLLLQSLRSIPKGVSSRLLWWSFIKPEKPQSFDIPYSSWWSLATRRDCEFSVELWKLISYLGASNKSDAGIQVV